MSDLRDNVWNFCFISLVVLAVLIMKFILEIS